MSKLSLEMNYKSPSNSQCFITSLTIKLISPKDLKLSANKSYDICFYSDTSKVIHMKFYDKHKKIYSKDLKIILLKIC